MGVVCDANHKPIIYDHTLDDYTIMNGIVIAKNKKVFDVINERLINTTGNDLPYYQKQAIEETKEYQRQKKLRQAKAAAEAEARAEEEEKAQYAKAKAAL